jgi:hypothetical protein
MSKPLRRLANDNEWRPQARMCLIVGLRFVEHREHRLPDRL